MAWKSRLHSQTQIKNKKEFVWLEEAIGCQGKERVYSTCSS